MAFVLRFLQSTKFNNKAALKAIDKYIIWRETNFPLKVNAGLAEVIVIACANRIEFRLHASLWS
jgi:hypothetical protein